LRSPLATFDLWRAIAPANDLAELRESRELPRIDCSGRGDELAAAIEELAGECDQPRVRPCLRPDLNQPSRDRILPLCG
jgi:hypothetical protein